MQSRRDKYESHIREYWVDTKTIGTMEKAQEETLIDETGIEGEADGSELHDLGIPEPVALGGAVLKNLDSEDEELGDGEDDDNRSVKSGRSRVSVDAECEKQSALEACSDSHVFRPFVSPHSTCQS